jgi:hypothetical protein
MLAARQQGPDAAAAEQGLAADAARAKAGAVERVPEAQGLEAAGGGARELDRHLDGVADPPVVNSTAPARRSGRWNCADKASASSTARRRQNGVAQSSARRAVP